MAEMTCSVTPVRAVMLNVASLEPARRFYEEALGMACLAQLDDVGDGVRRLWGLGAGRARLASMGQPANSFGTVELVAWEGCSGRPLRDQVRPFDYGILTLNLRTTDIEKALDHLVRQGARVISKPVSYPYRPGVRLHEAMVIGPHQERYTLLQIGDAQPPAGHIVGDVVATVGTVVPDVRRAADFYRDALGMRPALEMDESGELIAPLLGMPSGFRMRMAMFTAGDCWIGKIEAIEFAAQTARFKPRPILTDWSRTGYCMLSIDSADPAELAACLARGEHPVERAAAGVERPFAGRTDAFIIRAPGGVVLEVLDGAKGGP